MVHQVPSCDDGVFISARLCKLRMPEQMQIPEAQREKEIGRSDTHQKGICVIFPAFRIASAAP